MANSEQTEKAILLPFWHVYNVKIVCGIQNRKITETCDNSTPTGSAPSGKNGVLSQGIYSTEVNIFNYHDHAEAHVFKYYVPLVKENVAVGFEPAQQPARPFASIILRPNSATGDDCCGIEKNLKVKNLLNIGFLKIVSNIDLAVTAVYTAADIEKNAVVSIDVEQVPAKMVSFFRRD
jgi:hypothetical protein